nr:MAG TPA: hypothetical protein [Caudoviricetes sp.]
MFNSNSILFHFTSLSIFFILIYLPFVYYCF